MNQYVTGAMIKRIRESRKMTQHQLAEKLSVSDKVISKWETGRGLPDITLIEPIAESPYSRWLVEHGPGLHHIAVDTEDDYDGILQSYQEEKGEKPWIRATGMNGLMDYSYLDFRKEMGLIMECYRNIEPGRTGIDPDYKGELV